MSATSKAVFLGATGAVGRNALGAAISSSHFAGVTMLGRRPLPPEDPLAVAPKLTQHVVDVFDAATYESLLAGHDVAICTLGVGQPTKVPRDEVLRTDVDAVVLFAAACKRQGIRHFSLLTAVGANAKSGMWYLRMKGELEDKIKDLRFARCSFFRPSMLLTPHNRYGLSQGLLLYIWPAIDWMFAGPLRKYRGIRVSDLGRAMVKNAENPPVTPAVDGVEYIDWDGFAAILRKGA